MYKNNILENTFIIQGVYIMKVKKVFIDYIYITVGTLLLALAVNSFLLPSKISSGGISTIGTILIYLLGMSA